LHESVTTSATSLACIVASNSPDLFQTWLRSNYPELGQDNGSRVVLVPWGDQAPRLRRLVAGFPNVTMVEPTADPGLEANRNVALGSLRANPPELVAFLDDDTFLEHGWTDAMLRAAIERPSSSAFASIVTTDGKNELQSCGHAFVGGAPRDRGYRGRGLDRPVVCPCGNSAVVRWSAIERIRRVDELVWDPAFKGDQTCFDFGLKLVLTGSRTSVVGDARARHRGYLPPWGAKKSPEERRHRAVRQLACRLLLYEKFLAGDALRRAVSALEARLPKWSSFGYPAFDEIRGAKVAEVYHDAQREFESWQYRTPSPQWKECLTQAGGALHLFDLPSSPPKACAPVSELM